MRHSTRCVIVDGAVVCILASDERVDSADIAAVMGIEVRDVTVRRLDKVTVTMPGEVDKVTVAVDLSRD